MFKEAGDTSYVADISDEAVTFFYDFSLRKILNACFWNNIFTRCVGRFFKTFGFINNFYHTFIKFITNSRSKLVEILILTKILT